MPADLDGLFGRKPLLARIIVVADEFLFLGVHRNHRPSRRQGFFNAGVDMAELRIPVGVIVAFLGLAIALQTVVLGMEQLGHLHMADGMLLPPQLRCNGPRTFANPPQGRFRIAPGLTVNQLVQRAQKPRIRKRDALASRARAPDMTFQRAVPCLDFAKAFANRLAGQAASSVHDRNPAITQR